MIKKILIGLIFFSAVVFSQSKDPDVILNNVIKSFEKIEDYVVDVNIKVDVSFLKVPEADAKIYFKQPDKVHFESDGFALLPKQGINFSPISLLNTEYSAFYGNEVILNGNEVSVIKIIPLNEKSNVILSTFWIDQINNRIIKVESSRKPSGTFILEFIYPEKKAEFILPELMVFTFSIDNMRLPMDIAGETGSENNSENEGDEKVKSGKVYIRYSNYIINNGLPDNIFTEEKDE